MDDSQGQDIREPRFRRRAEARPDEVLDAALRLFAAQGFGHTTVEQVARAAGLSKAAVYLYFPSKTALLAGWVGRAVAAGQIRNVDPDLAVRSLAVRSLVGPILAHVVLAEVFGIVPEGGMDLERLVDNHLTILMAGLAPERAVA